jgi:hypothetical protein
MHTCGYLSAAATRLDSYSPQSLWALMGCQQSLRCRVASGLWITLGDLCLRDTLDTGTHVSLETLSWATPPASVNRFWGRKGWHHPPGCCVKQGCIADKAIRCCIRKLGYIRKCCNTAEGSWFTTTPVFSTTESMLSAHT